MYNFKARILQICWDCPRPHWGSLLHFPDPSTVFHGPTSNRRGGKEGKGKESDVCGTWIYRLLPALHAHLPCTTLLNSEECALSEKKKKKKGKEGEKRK